MVGHLRDNKVHRFCRAPVVKEFLTKFVISIKCVIPMLSQGSDYESFSAKGPHTFSLPDFHDCYHSRVSTKFDTIDMPGVTTVR